MEKKKYIVPAIATIEVDGESLLLTASGQPGEEVGHGSNMAPSYGEEWYSDYNEEY